MSLYTDTSTGSGGAHGRTSPLRVDPSTMLGLIVVAALLIILGLHLAFRGAVSAGFSVGR